ncbi:hypothetical protein GCM10011513_25050 [Franconibacter daqui]|nr:hypothetical protein GCM10011513_25050 [Franconibacter daqui]
MISSRLTPGFKAFFDNVFQIPILKAQVGKPLFEALALILKILDLFNIKGFHAAVSGLPVIAGGFRDTGLPAKIFNSSSDFNRLNHGDDLMLSKTGFTHSDLIRWQIDYAG